MPGPLPALASPAQLAALTGLSASDTRLVAQLREASRQFRSAVRHPVTRVTGTVQLDGRGGTKLLLPRPYPILPPADAVGETPEVIFTIEIDGDLVPADRYRVNWASGIVTLRDEYRWPLPPADIVVTRTAGYVADLVDDELLEVPEEIQAAVLEKAQILLNVVLGVTQKSVLGDSTSFGGSAVGVTQAWSDAVAAHYEATGDRA